MPNIQSVSPRRLIRALEKCGCSVVRQHGSHVILKNIEKKKTTLVSVHPGDMKKNAIRTILKQIDISEDDFGKAL
jgi:predicted RNA binding protein YcfA (HicA-like mRNA interferase family)